MADGDIQSLLVRIEATTAQLRQEMARGESSVNNAANQMDRSLGRIDQAFDNTANNASVMQRAISGAFSGMGLAATAAVAGLVAITTQATEYAQEIRNLSALSNTTVTDFQRLAAGAKTVGVEQDKLADIFKDVNDRVGEFMQRGGGEMQDFFKEIAPHVSVTTDQLNSLSKATGVTIAHFASLSGPEALQLYYTSLEKAGLNQQQMTTYMEAMADEATALIPLLKNGGQGFREIGDHAQAAGKILNAFEVDRLVKANVSIKELQGSLDGAARQMVIGLLPAIEDVTGRLTEMSKNGAMDIIGSAVGVLVENLNLLVAVLGGKVAASFVGYITGLANSTVATYQSRAANIAAAASAAELALANQIAAQSAVVRAEREALAARGTAVQTQMSIQLAEARMVERNATAQLAAAQAGLRASQGGIMALLGGPAGLAALVVGAGIAFLTMGGNAKSAGADLEALKRPIAELRKEFQALTRDQKEATIVTALRQQEQVAGEADQAFAAFLKTSREVLGSTVGTRVASEFETARKSGGGLTSTLDELQKRFRIPEEGMRTLKESAGAFSSLQVASGQAAAKVAAYREELAASIKPSDGKAEADKLAAKAVETYTEELDKQLTKLKDKTAVEQAGTWLTEHKIAAESELGKKVLEHAKAIDAQKKADKDATEATNAAASASKKAATEAENRSKALVDLQGQIEREIKAANGMADAYARGVDKSREFTLQQRVEEALLKTGGLARAAVEKAINAQAEAQDRLNVTKAAYELEKETADLIAQAKAQLAGADALEAYNLQKSMALALAGKNIAVGSKEYDLLLDANRARQDAVKLAKQAEDVGTIMDRLYPEAAALREYRAEQDVLNAAMRLYPENAAQYQDALVRLGSEYEVNRSKATLWGQMTEGAIDRIDQAFANAWGNIGSGASTLWDDLKKGFRQTLGEIMHMLTTKPLLASLSNWLTGTDNGQGLGSVWGKLLGNFSGGGSSSGGGGLWSGVVEVGKNLSSVWSTLTGVGPAATAGYASGGITGAISGIGTYYSSMFTSAFSTVSSAVTSLTTAMGLNTAATAAATTATTSYAIGGSLVSGGVGSATYATGTSAMSSALASMGAMWPLAVILGMYQSGKLYDAGVRPDASEVWNSAGDTALGKAVMTPATLGAKWLEIKDRALGKIFGDKLAAIITGSTVFQAVWTKVGGKLFGTGYQTKDSGIQLGVEDGKFQPFQYVDQKKKGGLISGSSKKRTLYSALDADTEKALGQAYNGTITGVLDLFNTINVALNEHVLDNLDVAVTKISTQGKTAQDIQKEVDAWFTTLGDSAVQAIATATGESSVSTYTLNQLQTSISALNTLNSVLEKTNNGLMAASVGGLHLAERLAEISGGVEKFTELTSTYYSAFISEAERADDTLLDVQRQFKAMNVVFPETRDGFRKAVEALDVTTTAGQDMYVTLMALAQNADVAYQILESRMAASKQAMLEAVGVQQSALQRAVEAEKKAAQKAFEARTSSINDMLSTAQEAASSSKSISSALEAAMKALRGTSEESVRALHSQAKATVESALAIARAGGSLASFTGLEDALSVISGNDTSLYASLEDFNREQGRNANLVAELNKLNGKQLSSADKTVKALQDQLKQAQDTYQAQVDGLDAQLEWAQQQMDALNGVDNSVKSVADAIKEMNAAVVAAISTITGKITPQNAGTLVDSLYKDVLGRDADKGGKDYWVGELTSGKLNGGNVVGAFTNAAAIELAYKAAGIAMNEGSAYWSAQLASGALTPAQLNEAVRNAAIANGSIPARANGGLITGPGTGTSDSILARLSNGEYVMRAAAVRAFGTDLLDQMNAGQMPAFAVGGVVGEGPVLQITRPAQIYAGQAQAQVGQVDGTAKLLDELRQLRQENKQAQFQIAKNTQRIETLMRKWDEEGTPQERDYA